MGRLVGRELAVESEPKLDIRGAGAAFQIDGHLVEVAPYGSGHINDTFLAVYEQDGGRRRYILQRINHGIFQRPIQLMENVQRVTEHQQRLLRAAGAADSDRRALTLVPTRDGKVWHQDAQGNTWRTYLYIEGARTHDVILNEGQAYQVARAFGAFQGQLAGLGGERLHETIPNFHHTPLRFAALEAAIEADERNRAATCRPDIEFCLRQKPWIGRLISAQARGEIPERVTHNDTKLNNVMIDDATGEGICVIDLDIVMPGLALYDFGDMVRTCISPAGEDERDLSKVAMRMSYFEALVRGYHDGAGRFLTSAERNELAFSGKLITFEIGVRFLTDYLRGDIYFKTHRPGHNLDRCRTQFQLARCIAEREDELNEVVEGVWVGSGYSVTG